MATALRPLSVVQVGEEVTRGTAVAATRRLLTKSASYRETTAQENFDGQMHGLVTGPAIPPIITRNGVEFEFASDLDFEQVILFLLSGVEGAVTPTTPGSGEGRLWTFTPPVAADPAPDTYTLEYVEDDGTNEDEYESAYCFTTRIQISGGVDALPQISASMVGRKSAASTKTAAIALPTLTKDFAGNLTWQVWIDGTWANLGTTQITGQVYGFTWTLEGLLFPQYYLDGRADLDFSNYQFGVRTADLSLDVAIDPDSGAYETERTAKLADPPTQRAVRVQLNGGAFDSPDNGLSRFLRIDGAYYHAEDSLVEYGGDRDGSSIVSMHLLSSYESTQAQDIEIAVQNNLASFP